MKYRILQKEGKVDTEILAFAEVIQYNILTIYILFIFLPCIWIDCPNVVRTESEGSAT